VSPGLKRPNVSKEMVRNPLTGRAVYACAGMVPTLVSVPESDHRARGASGGAEVRSGKRMELAHLVELESVET
jgi:hypothetical protein